MIQKFFSRFLLLLLLFAAGISVEGYAQQLEVRYTSTSTPVIQTAHYEFIYEDRNTTPAVIRTSGWFQIVSGTPQFIPLDPNWVLLRMIIQPDASCVTGHIQLGASATYTCLGTPDFDVEFTQTSATDYLMRCEQ